MKYVKEDTAGIYAYDEQDGCITRMEADRMYQLPTTVINRGGHCLRERLRHFRHGRTSRGHSSGTVSVKTLRRKCVFTRVERRSNTQY